MFLVSFISSDVLTCNDVRTVASGVHNSYLTTAVDCNVETSYLGQWTRVCVPVDSAGIPILGSQIAPASELNGATAASLALAYFESYQLQFTGLPHEGLIFESFLLLNVEQSPPSFFLPSLGLWSMNPQESLSMQEILSRTPSSATFDPTTDMTFSLMMTYGRCHFVQFIASRFIRLDGSEELKYIYYPQGEQILSTSPEFTNERFAALLNATSDELERSRLQTLRADPNVTLSYSRLKVRPASMYVQVIREVQPYTFASFVSDVGGFLNIMVLFLIFLFPFTIHTARPRTFLVLWVLVKWRKFQSNHNVSAIHTPGPDSTNDSSISKVTPNDEAGVTLTGLPQLEMSINPMTSADRKD